MCVDLAALSLGGALALRLAGHNETHAVSYATEAGLFQRAGLGLRKVGHERGYRGVIEGLDGADGQPSYLGPGVAALPGPRELAPGADRVELKLAATAANGEKVVQVLTFHRGSYVIDVAYDITNAGTAPIAPFAYREARDRQILLTARESVSWLDHIRRDPRVCLSIDSPRYPLSKVTVRGEAEIVYEPGHDDQWRDRRVPVPLSDQFAMVGNASSEPLRTRNRFIAMNISQFLTLGERHDDERNGHQDEPQDGADHVHEPLDRQGKGPVRPGDEREGRRREGHQGTFRRARQCAEPRRPHRPPPTPRPPTRWPSPSRR